MADTLPREFLDELRKKATPAHVAQYVTRELPPDTQWRPFKHLMFINEKIVEACTSNEQTFLNVAVSVRAGKSELISRYLPIWYLGMYPDRQVIIVSYNESKAAEWGTFARDIFKQYGPELFGLTVDPDTASKTEWKIKGRRGGMRAVGVNGSLTGIGGDLILIDDPLKNREEADSATARNNMFSWYGSTLRTRLMPHGTLILTMARWHEMDITGMILKAQAENEGGDPWQQISLPALAEPPANAPEDWTDILGRKPGEALWPEVWPKEKLLQIKASILGSDWDSLYQQNPTPAEGGMFKVDAWRYTSGRPAGLRLCRAWDLAATQDGGDWTVGALVGMTSDNRVFVCDIVRAQLDSAGVKRLVLDTAKLDGRLVPIRIEQERAGAGKSQVADYKRLLIGYDVRGRKPEGSKEQRAAPYASQQQESNVYLVDADRWGPQFVEEHRRFPKGRHDDQIDATASAFDELAQVAPVVITSHEDVSDVPIDRLLQAGFGRSPQFTIPVG